MDRAQLAPQIRRPGQSPLAAEMRTPAQTLRAAANELRGWAPTVLPDLAVPLADWLELESRRTEDCNWRNPPSQSALVVARVILGESS